MDSVKKICTEQRCASQLAISGGDRNQWTELMAPSTALTGIVMLSDLT